MSEKIAQRDRKRYWELVKEYKKRGGFFTEKDELLFLRDKLGRFLTDDLKTLDNGEKQK